MDYILADIAYTTLNGFLLIERLIVSSFIFNNKLKGRV